MTKAQIIVRAIEGRIACIQAATILGVGDRHSRRLKERYERDGYDGLRVAVAATRAESVSPRTTSARW